MSASGRHQPCTTLDPGGHDGFESPAVLQERVVDAQGLGYEQELR